MNTAQVIGYPLLIIAAFELFLGLLLLKQNPRNSPVNKVTAACVFAAALWALSSGFMYIFLAVGRDFHFFARFSWIGWFTVPTAIQTVFYLEDEQSRKARVAGWVLYPFWAVVLGLCVFTDLIVTGGYMPLPYRNSPGPLEMPLRVLGSVNAFWLIAEIVRLRRRTAGVRRVRLGYYLYGTVLFTTGGAVIGGFLQVFTGHGLEPSLSVYFSLPWSVMIFYAITRHRLFDIRFVVSRTLNILLLSFFISAFQFIFFRALEPIVGPVVTIFISIPIIGVLFFGTPLSRTVQRWINELVLRGRYQYQSMLKESADAMVTILDRDEVLRFSVESVRKWIGPREITLYLQGGDGAYAVRYASGRPARTIEGNVLPKNVADGLTERAQAVVREELSEGGDDALLDTLRRIDAELLLPLNAKGRMLGVMTLSERASGEPYLQGDLDALQTLASQTAAAIENARLFEEAVRARALQQESENIFRTLAETTTAAILILRLDRILYVNKACAFLTGYGREELLTMNPWSLVHPDHRKDVYERGRSVVGGMHVPPENEFRFVTRGGEVRWVVSSTASIVFQGEPAIISTMVDITDLKRAEEAKIHFFKESAKHYQEKIAEQERFSAILQATSDGFWIVNEENRIVFVNDAACRLAGYARQELVGLHVADLEAMESPEVVERHTTAIREAGHDLFETRHRRKDGTVVDLEVSVNLFKDGKTVFSFLRDITERKKVDAERARLNDELVRYYRERLAEQERFQTILAHAKEGFWITDEKDRFLFVNDAYLKLMGWERDELMQRAIGDVELIESPEVIEQHTARIRERGYEIFETKHRRKDGTPVDLEVSVTFYQPEHVFFSFFRDIRERKRAEEERARMIAEKDKILKDLHDGIGGIATNIKLLAEMAQQQSDRFAVTRALATIAELSRESLSEIRSFIQSLDTRELTWQAIAAEFRHIGSTIIEPHGIRFDIAVSVPDGGPSPTSAVAMSLFRVYKESLANVVKHARATSVTVRFAVDAGRVSLDVRDDGIGLDGNRGSGRGLANIRNRAGEMGGTVAFTSEQGTRMCLEFPIP